MNKVIMALMVFVSFQATAQTSQLTKGYVVGSLKGIDHVEARSYMRQTNNEGVLFSCKAVKLNSRTGSFQAVPGAKPFYYKGVPPGLSDSYWDAETAALAKKSVLECQRKVANKHNKSFSNY